MDSSVGNAPTAAFISYLNKMEVIFKIRLSSVVLKQELSNPPSIQSRATDPLI
jgi:hypothetical protein